MKVGILTFHRSYNYGAFMQCFSLLQRLKKDFPDVEFEVIDYNTKSIESGYAKWLDGIQDADTRQKVQTRNTAFEKCQIQLPLSPFRLIDDDYSSIITYMNNTYDAVIVGSDAVWNWVARGFPTPYFLKDYRGIKLSYAASVHGMVYQNMTEEQKLYLQEAFRDFRYIGVRDQATEDMVHYVCPELEVHHNCDPTVLLDLNDVPCDKQKLKEKLENHGVDFSKPLVGMMAGRGVGYDIKRHFKDQIQLVSVYEPNPYADVYLYDLTPYEWAHVFSWFKTTATHFFHGTLLTLVNRVPVTSIEFENAYSVVNTTKIKDVLTRLGLTSWRFTADYRNMSKPKKVLMRFNLWRDKKLWRKVNKHIENMLVTDQSDLIKTKIAEEAKAYDSFRQALELILREG